MRLSSSATAAHDLRQNHNYIRRKPVGSIDLGRLAAANRPSLLPTPVTLPTSSSGNSLGSYNSHSSKSRNETNNGAGSISGNGGASTSSTVSGLRRSNSAIVNQKNKAFNSPPTCGTAPTEKASFQFPASRGGFYETKNYRHINPNASAKSFSSRRPLSYIINNNNNNDNNNSNNNYANNKISSNSTENHGDNRSQPSRRPMHGHSQSFSYGTTNSIAVGVPSFEFSHNNGAGSESTAPRNSIDNRSDVDAGWRWKYHIKPHRHGDLFMTTNPDAAHAERPVAPSYFVSVARTAPDGGRGFSLSFIDPVKRFCEVVITRQFRGNRDFFEVLLYKKIESFDFGFGDISGGGAGTGSTSSLVGGGRALTGEENARLARQVAALTDGALLVSSERTELAWKGCAFLRNDEQQQQKRSPSLITSSGGSSSKITREYVLQDDWRRTWVVGTKKPQLQKRQSQYYDLDNEDDENDEFPNFSQLANKLLAPRRPKSDVYFSLQQGGADNGDRLISVLQRKNGSISRSKKHSRSESYDERARDGSSNKGIIPDDFGTLSVLEKVSQNIWPVSIALSVAVSYALYLDHGSGHHYFNSSHTAKNGSGTNEGGNSVTEKFKRLGRKYKEGRLQVFYGNAL
jgi:hypothetical protein